MSFENNDQLAEAQESSASSWLDGAVLNNNDDYFKSVDRTSASVQPFFIVADKGAAPGTAGGSSSSVDYAPSNGRSDAPPTRHSPNLSDGPLKLGKGEWVTREIIDYGDKNTWSNARSRVEGSLDKMADENKAISDRERDGLKTLQQGIMSGDPHQIWKFLWHGKFSNEELRNIVGAFNENMKDKGLDHIAQMSVSEKTLNGPVLEFTSKDQSTRIEFNRYFSTAEGNLVKEQPPLERSRIIGPSGSKPETVKGYPDKEVHALSVIAEKLISHSSGQPMPKHAVERKWFDY